MFCTQCGQALEVSQTFCTKCGFKVDSNPNTTGNNKTLQSSWLVLPKLVGYFLGTIIVLINLFVRLVKVSLVWFFKNILSIAGILLVGGALIALAIVWPYILILYALVMGYLLLNRHNL